MSIQDRLIKWLTCKNLEAQIKRLEECIRYCNEFQRYDETKQLVVVLDSTRESLKKWRKK